jgi:hypothetical protein
MSKFKGGLEAYKQRTNENTENTEQVNQNTTTENNSPIATNPQTNRVTNNTTTNLTNTANTTTSNIASTDKDKTNRKQSKEYQQVNSYVPKQLYKKVKIALVEEERGISDLITELLGDWINKRAKQ